MVSSSEPTNPTYVGDRFTNALVKFLKNKEQKNGKLLFPFDFNVFNHLGKT